MERSGRHAPEAATVAVRAALVSEETGSAFYTRGGVTHHRYSCHGTVYISHIFCLQAEFPPERKLVDWKLLLSICRKRRAQGAKVRLTSGSWQDAAHP